LICLIIEGTSTQNITEFGYFLIFVARM